MWGSGTRPRLGVGPDLGSGKSRVEEGRSRFTIAIANYGRRALRLRIHEERKNVCELNGVLGRRECRLGEGVGCWLGS